MRIILKRVLSQGVLLLVLCFLLTGCADSADFDSGKGITVVSREDGSGTRGAFVDLFGIIEKNPDGTKKDRTLKDAVISQQTGIMMINIAGNPYTMGYISLGSLNDTVKALEIDNITPSTESVKNETYPIVRPFNIATKGEPTGLTKDFIEYMLSAEGQAVIAKSYISVDDNTPTYAGVKPAGRIVVAGSSSVMPVMEKLKEAYLVLNRNATIEIQMSDSSTGLKSTMDGICDIGMSSRNLTASELAQLQPKKIALDAIVIIVNKNNPLTSLSKSQVKLIFTGMTKTWDEVMP